MKIRQVKGLLLSMVTVTVLIGSSALCALAAEYRSVAKDGINLRSGPGTNYEVIYQLPQHYPLQILSKKGDWLKVVDYEGDKGWIHRSLVQAARYVIVKKKCNMRSGPSTNFDKIGSLEKDVILKVVKRQGGWVEVSHPQITGWVFGLLVWP